MNFHPLLEGDCNIIFLISSSIGAYHAISMLNFPNELYVKILYMLLNIKYKHHFQDTLSVCFFTFYLLKMLICKNSTTDQEKVTPLTWRIININIDITLDTYLYSMPNVVCTYFKQFIIKYNCTKSI